METVSEKIFNTSGEMLYDRYSRMIYQMAVQIAQDKKNAEEILVGTFRKLYARAALKNQGVFFTASSLMRMVIQTAHERLCGDGSKTDKQVMGNEISRVSATDLKIDKLFCNCFGYGR